MVMQQAMTRRVFLGCAAGAAAATRLGFAANPDERRLIEEAIPAQALVSPRRRRRLLIFDLNVAYGGHGSIPTANTAFELMGRKTGAFETVISKDPSVFERESLRRFDAVFFNNTAGNHEALGRLMRRDGARLGLGRAKIKYAVTDGADWIARQYRQQLPMLDEHILDYYHLREHVVQSSHVLYGEGTPKAQAWQEDMMGHVWEHGSLVMLHRLDPYLRRHRRGPKREVLRSLRDYVGKRVAMTDYPAFRQLGYDCGSGPTESLCGTLTNRLKGSGMRWDKDNAEHMMALGAIYHSRLWQAYWKGERKAG